MPIDIPPPVRRLQAPGASALVFDARTPEGRQAVGDHLRRLGSPAPRAGPAARRAGVAVLCGEAFCRALESGRGGFPWDLV
jgi:hypothetical protein